MPGVAERLLAVLLDGSPVEFILLLVGLLALDVRRHLVVPVLRAWGAPGGEDRGTSGGTRPPRAPSRRRGR